MAELGDSDSLMVGDWVLAVGSPLGFESTVTAGIVSAIGRRSVQGAAGFTDYIQTDAAINQGNSGGALVNIYGQVVGINSWIASTSGGNIGLGFAIPINNAKRAIDDFITKGKSEYGWIGINMGGLQPQAAEDLKLGEAHGAFVYGVFKGSPADKAGLLPGDMITKVDGKALKDSSDLLLTIGNLTPGTQGGAGAGACRVHPAASPCRWPLAPTRSSWPPRAPRSGPASRCSRSPTTCANS